jgi:hypothetical protein
MIIKEHTFGECKQWIYQKYLTITGTRVMMDITNYVTLLVLYFKDNLSIYTGPFILEIAPELKA